MAGGVGSRFWPASLEEKPKQFLDIMGSGQSLLQITFNRFKSIIPVENIFVVTNAAYIHHINEQLPELKPHQILAEPSRNNTAPCIAYMALKLKKINPNAVFVVAPSDHIISDSAVFLRTIEQAFEFSANHNALMTLGITPTHPNTGYGYIQFNRHDANNDGIYKVNAFKEKPILEKAQEFLAAGNYLWNGGIFVWSVKRLLQSFERNAPEILERAGIGSKDSLFNSIAIGGTNLIFTFIGLYLIDRIGRKQLLIIGSLGYIVSLAMVAWSFYTHAGNSLLMGSLLLFIGSHAIGQGAVIWVFISEIFPNKIRALGQSFGCSVHWVFAAAITLITPVFLDAKTGIFRDNPWPIFAFFSAMMVLQLLWVVTKVPETKGVSLEELEKKLIHQ